MEAVICIPWRDMGCEWRARALEYVLGFWAEHFPDLEIHMADGGTDGPMNRSRARNQAAEKAGSSWDVALFADADTIGEPTTIRQAIELAGSKAAMVHPFTHFEGLDQSSTAGLLAGRPPQDPRRWKKVRNSPGGLFAIGRPLWEELGGFDEGFSGWGFEDVAFHTAALTLGGVHRLEGTIRHLWHPLAPEKNRRHPDWIRNQTRRRRYLETEGNPEAMRELLTHLKATT